MTHLVEPQPRTWTRSEYHRMGELGWFDGQRVQLIEGEVIVMSPQNFPHARTVDRVFRMLDAAVRPQFWVRSQLPVVLPDQSEPEPDISVVPGSETDYTDHPTTAHLVIEVSDTTLAFDRHRKRRVYARAGIPNYWIIDLVHQTIEVYEAPDPAAAEPDYGTTTVLHPGQALAFPGLAQVSWPVEQLLP